MEFCGPCGVRQFHADSMQFSGCGITGAMEASIWCSDRSTFLCRVSDDVKANVQINVSGELSNCWADSSKRTRKMSVSVIVHVLRPDECVSLRTAACSGTTVLARTFVIEFLFSAVLCAFARAFFGCRRQAFDFWLNIFLHSALSIGCGVSGHIHNGHDSIETLSCDSATSRCPF